MVCGIEKIFKIRAKTVLKIKRILDTSAWKLPTPGYELLVYLTLEGCPSYREVTKRSKGTGRNQQ